LNSFMSWVGGKKALREEVVQRFPLYYERYIEVFGGGGWVLFHKPPGRDFEVYNDFNSLLANLYRCVRDKPDLLMNAIYAVKSGRQDLDKAAFLQMLAQMKTRGARYFILGCTELPLAVQMYRIQAPCVDPTLELAKGAIRQAGGTPACVAGCPNRALDFGEVGDLRARYGTVADLAPLPSASVTSPHVVITLPRCLEDEPSRAGTGEVQNRREIV